MTQNSLPSLPTPPKKPLHQEKSSDDADKMMVFKIIMLGDAAVGKTSLVQRYIHGSFKGSYKATLGLDLSLREIKIDNIDIRLQLWDLSGQTQFKTMRKRFYGGTSAAILMFDVTRPITLQNLNLWLEELKENVGHVPFAVVGNKIDIKELVATDDTEEVMWAAENDAIAYLRTSAKTGKNVDKVFDLLAGEILEGLE